MLRLPPTTLSLTMTEVKDFERHLRFKKYLAKEDSLGKLPIRVKKTVVVADSFESEYDNVNQPTSELPSRGSSDTPVKESSHLPACPPQRPLKLSSDSVESSPPGIASSSQAGTPTSSTLSHPMGWGNLPATLPPPFSKEKRSISDAQSLPSAHGSMRARVQPRRDSSSQEPPETPPRRSSLRMAHTDVRSGSPTLRRKRPLVSSAVRFVESIIHPHNRSPSSNMPRGVDSSEPSSPEQRDGIEPTSETELGFMIYNDSLPASSQPQTPLNLPEARHQSRLHGLYTAPLPRAVSRSVYGSSTRQGLGDSANSPSDLEAPGFRGLYGGQENSEDSTVFYEASMFQEEDPVESG
ncbi:uncharacterized protein F4812DRAFT_416626 [Daldinia caldariorum]|uniref:uncharacterized protein n=1 Tax=Daldinia caldariorum TaxID=326644 RepID=UPI002008ABB4|nr:uncharacterized protein F4812DRAFT_416626 [Daldinia caldariorum]KAI1472114.1 hypothetical protein F4812DRAFT_416626 [Daldinia caldariorum]